VTFASLMFYTETGSWLSTESGQSDLRFSQIR